MTFSLNYYKNFLVACTIISVCCPLAPKLHECIKAISVVFLLSVMIASNSWGQCGHKHYSSVNYSSVDWNSVMSSPQSVFWLQQVLSATLILSNLPYTLIISMASSLTFLFPILKLQSILQSIFKLIFLKPKYTM